MGGSSQVAPADEPIPTFADFDSPEQEELKLAALKAKTLSGSSAAAAVTCPQCARTFENMTDLHAHFDFVHVNGHVNLRSELPNFRAYFRALRQSWPRQPPLTPRTKWRSTPLERQSRLLFDRTVFVGATLAKCLWSGAKLGGKGCAGCCRCCGGLYARWQRRRVEQKYGSGAVHAAARRERRRQLLRAPARCCASCCTQVSQHTK